PLGVVTTPLAAALRARKSGPGAVCGGLGTLVQAAAAASRARANRAERVMASAYRRIARAGSACACGRAASAARASAAHRLVMLAARLGYAFEGVGRRLVPGRAADVGERDDADEPVVVPALHGEAADLLVAHQLRRFLDALIL